MGKKRWATELNDDQFEWLKEFAEEVKHNGADKDFTGSIAVQELIEEARKGDRTRLIKHMVERYLQRRVDALQAQLDDLAGQQKRRADGKGKTRAEV